MEKIKLWDRESGAQEGDRNVTIKKLKNQKSRRGLLCENMDQNVTIIFCDSYDSKV